MELVIACKLSYFTLRKNCGYNNMYKLYKHGEISLSTESESTG